MMDCRFQLQLDLCMSHRAGLLVPAKQQAMGLLICAVLWGLAVKVNGRKGAFLGVPWTLLPANPSSDVASASPTQQGLMAML